MLILCSGPDTFFATQKAKELERAFREKYDPEGSSVEHLLGKDPISDLIQKSNTVSLFSPKRFFRLRNLLQDSKQAKLKQLANALQKDPENIIVVSVEEKPPKATILKIFEQVKAKLISYNFPEQKGFAFFNEVKRLGQALQVKDEKLLRQVAQIYEGDSWAAYHALLQCAAEKTIEGQDSTDTNIFELADLFLQKNKKRFDALREQQKAKEVFNILLSQSRSAIRVRDGSAVGIHPYVQKKMMRAHFESIEETFGDALLGQMLTRSGLCSDEEAAAILP